MAADNYETDTLVVDHHRWGSPGSIQLNSLNNENVPFVGRGYAPADPVRLRKQLPGFAGSDEGRSVNLTTSGKDPTFSPLISKKAKIFASFPSVESPLRHGLRRATSPRGRGKSGVPPLPIRA